MEEQMYQPMLMPECFTSGMLEKIFSIPGKSKMFMISNALLVVLPFCLLVLGADLTSVCVMVKILTTIEVLVKQDISAPEAKKLLQGIIESVWSLFGIQVFLMALFCIFSVVCLLVNGVNFKKILTKIGGQWRIRRIISWFHIMVSIIVIDVIVLILVGLLSAAGIDVALILLGVMFVVVGTLCCVYLVAVWMFSMAMSITEMHTSQVVVLEESDELIEGRRLQGFLLMMFASVFSIVTMVAFAFKTKKDDRGIDARFAKGIMILCYICLLKFFVFVLYIVYCYESKSKNGRQVNVEDGSGYSPIVTGEV